MRLRHGSGRWLRVFAVLTAAGCGGNAGGQTATQSGELLVSYFQGGPEPGAILLTVAGGPVEKVSAVGGQQVGFATPYAGTTRVVISGTIATGDILRLRVPDVSASTHYTVRVDQVADKTSFALIDASAYSFTVHR